MLVVMVSVFTLSGWQVYGLIAEKSSPEDPEVLAATTTKTLEERVASLESRVLTLERNTGLVKPKSTGKIKEQYVQLAGGSVNSASWTRIPGTEFYFDTALYGTSVEVSWQGWIDNGYGSVRIYDDTNHRAVDNSELSVDSGVKSSFYSKPMSIWRGQNQYHIEGKNPLGEIIISSPRLKIVTR
ncbi:MAG: hypothetical protein UW64_C0017G0031 [Microgenomates group bacterium GW2011_GWC1_44_37]|uniref:Uncharacterized protein n=1 Tax=Candidatus Collierbacteria bacterium GW2011_GWB2_44_22 TaxID=1618387 RepID=A0A0G1HXK7_9BACT|nr:MAG: hypothetical protein UW31_C0010G0049 [Candidatus Collierbacteria bacterium GW2011_GWA2_44_13]KKT51665.1 MAG: hypothetical protein UW44_C0009G0029 [Candidatus Collierbacteria bacterium GW2011_GWB2_44_22]KKT62593.1 MAG: hypothetical protein UW56_C0005G0029 [Candidatus Collierbacteria bacterium GW2011_GWD1_44_27]KKT66031.1 MAG: hypothetical protein UW58_C0014G0018 [Candidatus Collierbacteria bacterium GW2011_GWC2_44_30]KKT68521.1 MAG: hypothetical protein UW64_C0017G0031 [Microgenomates gr